MDCFGEDAFPARSKFYSVTRWFSQGIALSSCLLALIVLLVYLPILTALAMAVLFTSPGPALVKKAYRRSKKTAEVVYLYEFRTECWHTWQETAVGNILRRADLHRLPRLANVLMGHLRAGERVQPLGLQRSME